VFGESSNVHTELCISQYHRRKVRDTIYAVGHDRILFGTDLGLFDPAHFGGTYEEAELNLEEKAIMRGNAQKCLGYS